MLKTGKEYELERLNDTLEKELDLIEQKLLVSTKRSREKLDAIYPKVSSLNKLVSNIENQLRGLKSQNKYEIDQRVDRSRKLKENLEKNYKVLNEKLLAGEREELFKGKSQTSGEASELHNMKLVMDMNDRYKGVGRDVQETHEIAKGTLDELHAQGQTIDEIQREAQQAEQQLGMIDQLMRIISNRHLLTKLVLILLVVFLAAADLFILILKLT